MVIECFSRSLPLRFIPRTFERLGVRVLLYSIINGVTWVWAVRTLRLRSQDGKLLSRVYWGTIR